LPLVPVLRPFGQQTRAALSACGPARARRPQGLRGTIRAGPTIPPSPREENTMPTVIGHHDVKDTKHWLASPKREEFFGPLGVTNIRTFVDPQNPTRVAVL